MCVYVCVCNETDAFDTTLCIFQAKQCGERKQPQDKVSFCSSDCLLSFVMDSLIKKYDGNEYWYFHMSKNKLIQHKQYFTEVDVIF